MANDDLAYAKRARDDEFYTQFQDIEKEMNAYLEFDPNVFRDKTVLLPCDDPEWSNFTKYFAQKFEELGLKKLISTSFAPNSKPLDIPYQPTLFELESPVFDEAKTQANGKIFTLNRDKSGDGVINVEDLEWTYLNGDGDFRSEEIRTLRDEADIIITNPPFSLFREFLAWLEEAGKKFVILGNMNGISYKEVFPLIRDNKLWLGASIHSGDREFRIPTASVTRSPSRRTDENGDTFLRVPGVRWFTNMDHGLRHQPLSLMSEEDNRKFSKHKEVKGQGYRRYDNYDAIEVPFTDAIPKDFNGLMGVPISFLSKYNPEQFEILGITQSWDDKSGLKTKIYPQQTQISADGKKSLVTKLNDGATLVLNEQPTSTHYEVEGVLLTKVYVRILIRHRKPNH